MNLSVPRLELDHTKAVTRTKNARIPTAYAVNPGAKVSAMSCAHVAAHVYEIERVRYAVDPNVVGSDTRFEGYPYHPANLAVAMDAIRRVVAPGAAVHVIAGVPLNRFYLLPSGAINTSLSARKTAAWSRPVRSLQGLPLPRIAKVTVIAEGVAAWFDFVIDDNFVVRDDVLNDCMAVVDIGGRTTDIAVFQDGNVNLELSGTLDSGVLDIQSRVIDILNVRYPGMKVPRALLMEAVKFGAVRLGTGEIDIGEDVLDCRRSLAANIELFMRAKIGNQVPLMKRVLFVGGGAQVLQSELKECFPGAVFATDPQMANGRGMLKFGVAVAGFEEERVPANA
jgi:plasmid segregation protein ParM